MVEVKVSKTLISRVLRELTTAPGSGFRIREGDRVGRAMQAWHAGFF